MYKSASFTSPRRRNSISERPSSWTGPPGPTASGPPASDAVSTRTENRALRSAGTVNASGSHQPLTAAAIAPSRAGQRRPLARPGWPSRRRSSARRPGAASSSSPSRKKRRRCSTGLLWRRRAQRGDELRQVVGTAGQRPVDPARRVVLAVGVVVAALRAAELVAAEQQRDPFGQQQRGEEVAPLARPQGEHRGVVGRALDAAVPAAVVVGAVAVVLAVGLVVLGVVADEVGEREAVVDRDEVDRRGRTPAAVTEQVRASR